MAEIDTVTERFLEAVDTDPHTLAREGSACRATLEGWFRALFDELREAPTPLSLTASHRLGTVLAQCQAPKAVVLTAIRQSVVLFWSILLGKADPSDFTTLALHAHRLWATVDAHIDELRRGYDSGTATIDAGEHDLRRHYVGELLSGNHIHSTRLELIAAALNVQLHGTFQVLAADTFRHERTIRFAVSHVRAAGGVLFGANFLDMAVVFWPATDSPGNPVWQELPYRVLKDIPAGFVPRARGLAGIPRAARTAMQVARFLRLEETGTITVAHLWPRMARNAVDGIDQLAHDIRDQLAGLEPLETDRILGTVRTYLTTGSASATAQALHCHRNTVLKRLHRFREITEIDVTVGTAARIGDSLGHAA